MLLAVVVVLVMGPGWWPRRGGGSGSGAKETTLVPHKGGSSWGCLGGVPRRRAGRSRHGCAGTGTATATARRWWRRRWRAARRKRRRRCGSGGGSAPGRMDLSSVVAVAMVAAVSELGRSAWVGGGAGGMRVIAGWVPVTSFMDVWERWGQRRVHKYGGQFCGRVPVICQNVVV